MRGPRRPCSRASTLAITPVTPGAPMAIVSTCRSWITGIGRATLIAQPTDHDLAVLEPCPLWCLLPSRLNAIKQGVEAISTVATARLWRASSPVRHYTLEPASSHGRAGRAHRGRADAWRQRQRERIEQGLADVDTRLAADLMPLISERTVVLLPGSAGQGMP